LEIHKINIVDDIEDYNKILLFKEVSLFSEYYLKFYEKRILNDYENLQFKNIWLNIFDELSNQKYLILRDFHADNLFFLKDRKSFKKIGLIDFQDAVLGSATYDLVSLLEDARRDVSKNLQKYLINYYISKSNINKEEFLKDFNILSMQRNIKILGVFARQGFEYHNKRYLDFIPRILQYINLRINCNLFHDLKLFLKW
jgi:aminoglycoside/choline kinase family phosphotransferase